MGKPPALIPVVVTPKRGRIGPGGHDIAGAGPVFDSGHGVLHQLERHGVGVLLRLGGFADDKGTAQTGLISVEAHCVHVDGHSLSGHDKLVGIVAVHGVGPLAGDDGGGHHLVSIVEVLAFDTQGRHHVLGHPGPQGLVHVVHGTLGDGGADVDTGQLVLALDGAQLIQLLHRHHHRGSPLLEHVPHQLGGGTGIQSDGHTGYAVFLHHVQNGLDKVFPHGPGKGHFAAADVLGDVISRHPGIVILQPEGIHHRGGAEQGLVVAAEDAEHGGRPAAGDRGVAAVDVAHVPGVPGNEYPVALTVHHLPDPGQTILPHGRVINADHPVGSDLSVWHTMTSLSIH